MATAFVPGVARMLAVVGACALAACAEVDIENAPKGGRFDGVVSVFWLEENDTGSGSGGRFVYIPLPGNELTFTRDADAQSPSGNAVIQPGVIYTDGGSVPRAFQALRGFSPWSYGPVYIFHDWLFVAKRCARDDTASPAERRIEGMPFQETVDIFVETLVTLRRDGLVSRNDFSQGSISSAIAGPVSRMLWTDPTPCEGSRLSAQHQKLVDRILSARAQRGVLRAEGAEAVIDGQQVRLITQFEF